MNRARSAVLAEPMSPRQLRQYASLALAIQDAQGDGLDVPCIRNPASFDVRRPSQARNDLCHACPVFTKCRAYVDSGVEVSGFVGGRWV